MRPLRTVVLLSTAVAALAAGSAGAMAATPMAAAPMQSTTAPAVVVVDKQLGKLVATPGKLALYTWDREKDKKVHCVGTCAKEWPPVLVKKGVKVAAMVRGVKGEFGTTKRPNGTTQLTLNRQPVYTYEHDTPGVVLCDNVDGWHAVRAKK